MLELLILPLLFARVSDLKSYRINCCRGSHKNIPEQLGITQYLTATSRVASVNVSRNGVGKDFLRSKLMLRPSHQLCNNTARVSQEKEIQDPKIHESAWI